MSNITRTQAIQIFLNKFAVPDLASLYNFEMECQVNVAQDGGKPIQGDYKGKAWRGWTDGASTWKSFRVPFNAATNANYTDSVMNFDLGAHVEGIGMTGWNWAKRVSKYVAFDFDAMVGHSKNHEKKLTDEELKQIADAVSNVPWITLRRSTSGKGLHMYVFLNDVPTETHSEHAALARAILAKLSGLVGFDFQAKVDICGGNMWIWHRKQKGTNGLTIIKEGVILEEIPPNWKDHIKVCKGAKKRSSGELIEKVGEDEFDQLCGSNQKIPLDDEHKKLIHHLESIGATWWWDSERHMLVTHTLKLKQAHVDLNLKGIFETISKGSSEQNCYCFPMRRGAWNVRRFSPGCTEHESWTQDSGGWTRCYFNREADLKTSIRSAGGFELPDNKGYQFERAEMAVKALADLGAIIQQDAPAIFQRVGTIREQKDGRLVFSIPADTNDPASTMQGWQKIKDKWTRIVSVNTPKEETDIVNCDEYLRHIVTDHDHKDAGWVIRSETNWQEEPLPHVRAMLKSMGTKIPEVELVIGSCITRSWRIVSKPFQEEYTGNREWNRFAAKLRYVPTKDQEDLKFDSWKKIFNHLGQTLNEAVQKHPWCKLNGIETGADYLMLWVASMFQEPLQPLPYLFFFGPEDCGKSMFSEAIELLMTGGYAKVDKALTNPSGFNGEMLGAVLCVVEETNIKQSKDAYNRLKEWVTARSISIHTKGQTPYMMRNCAHFVQSANHHDYCPMFPGDTRIVAVRVESIDLIDMIPKEKLISQLEAQASDFLGHLLSLEIPDTEGRLNIPCLETTDKINMTSNNENLLEKFINEECYDWPGSKVTFAEFEEAFLSWLPVEDRQNWTKIKISKQFPVKYPRGRGNSNVMFIGNISFTKPPEGKVFTSKYIFLDDKKSLKEITL